MNPTNTGGVKIELLLNELKEFRNMLLVYRLIHFKDDIPDVDIGIIGRDKGLIKPTLQLFQDTKSKDQLIAAFQTILDLKNQRKGASLEAKLLLTLRNVVGINRCFPECKQKEIPFKIYWNQLRDDLLATIDERKPGEMHTTEYGTLYGSTIASILHDKFGTESKHKRNGNVLIVGYDTLEKLEKIYETKIIVKKITDIPTKGGQYKSGGEGGEHGEGSPKRESGHHQEETSKIEHEKDDNDLKEEKDTSKGEDPFSLLPSLPSRLHLSDPTGKQQEHKTVPEKKPLEVSKLAYGCYACKEFELTDDRETYKKHCIETHPNGKANYSPNTDTLVWKWGGEADTASLSVL